MLSLFSQSKNPAKVEIAQDSSIPSTALTQDSSIQAPGQDRPISTHLDLSPANSTEAALLPWFLPTQRRWILDKHPMKIWEKSRQVGATKTDAFDSVLKASHADAKFDVWVSSRDEFQARLYLEDCYEWAKLLNIAAVDLGMVLLDPKTKASAQVLQFANGRRIYCLSSNPNAFAGKRGHVKIDEFALHPDQRLLYKIAKPVTQWGGTFSLMSTHRGPTSLFNQIIRSIHQNPTSTPWKLYSYPIEKAVEEGLVQRINEKSGRSETNEEFLARIHAECIDEDQWNQEYRCIPADESAAFLTHDMITSCEDPNLHLLTTSQLIAWLKGSPPPSFFPSILDPRDLEAYIGIDVARKKDLYVMDVGIKLAGIMHDCVRFELLDQPFEVMEAELYPLLELPQVRRCCIEENGNAQQFAERAKRKFGCKVETIHTTGPIKERLAFTLRHAFETLALRIPVDPKLRSDLHGIRKQVTAAGNIRLDGYSDDSHCDRFWAKAFREEAARPYDEPYALLG